MTRSLLQLWPLAFFIACAAVAMAAARPVNLVKVEPKETDELLANPGMGWQTFYQFADEDPNLDGLPSGSAYIRFYWRTLEPEEGKINFAMLDDMLAHARRVGQKMSFRVMIACTDSDMPSGAPDWLRAKGCKGYEYRYQGRGRTYWVPDFDDPIFKQAHFRLIRELGKRYDGHPDIDYIDIGSVGLWGEWHMSGTGLDVPPLKTRLEIINAYCQAFPNTLKLMLIGDREGMKHAISRGCGWRADCLGDYTKGWNHMQNAYPQEVKESDAESAWKSAPVAWETCWDMRKWVQEGWDVRHIFDYALAYHGSYVNNKSQPIPEGYRGEVERLIRKLGYRLVLRSAEYPARVARGDILRLHMAWENVGVAPPYLNYLLAFRLTDTRGKTERAVSRRSIQGWLPGKADLRESFRVPTTLARGRCELAIGIVDPRTKQPAVRLAISGRDAEGWYSLGAVEID